MHLEWIPKIHSAQLAIYCVIQLAIVKKHLSIAAIAIDPILLLVIARNKNENVRSAIGCIHNSSSPTTTLHDNRANCFDCEEKTSS
jgi:hypothetical protein